MRFLRTVTYVPNPNGPGYIFTVETVNGNVVHLTVEDAKAPGVDLNRAEELAMLVDVLMSVLTDSNKNPPPVNLKARWR